ncbi:MAG TPA: hypothetical protein VLC79_17315 [Cellvibrio sp.]|nr:hypothetical protein [Cellvibrio sp.]
MKISLLIMAIVIAPSLMCGCASQSNYEPVQAVKLSDSDFTYFPDTQFDRFMVRDPQVFKQFDKVIFFPMQFDKLKIASAADKELVDSWNGSNWKEMDTICQHFDDFALKIFSEREGFTPVKRGGTDVLAIEFSLIKFMPYAKRYKDGGVDTVGGTSDLSGIGEITVRAVLANAKTGELVAVIEDTMQVNARNATTGNLAAMQNSASPTAQNAAWRTVFRSWVDDLHEELTRLKSAQIAVQ